MNTIINNNYTKEIAYRLLIMASHVMLIIIINTTSIIKFTLLILLSLLSSLLISTKLNIRKLNPFAMLISLFTLILIAFTGNILDNPHLCIAIVLIIPASFSLQHILLFIQRLYNEKHSVSLDNSNNKIDKKETVVILSSAFTVITLMSTSSPLYPFNYWDDANLFLTIGRCIVAGIIPYRDVYEQKGPALYFVHSLCSLIPGRLFFGVYLLEILNCFVFLYFSWKIVKLFVNVSTKKNTVIVTAPFAAIIYSCNMFHLGDSSEELAFPFLTIIFYLVLKAIIKENEIPSTKYILIMGIISGYLFWIKYTFCAFILGTVLFFVAYTIKLRKIKELIKSMIVFLLGVSIVTLPIVLYFLVTDSIKDLYTAYFYNNIFLYGSSTDSKIPLIQALANKAYRIPALFGYSFANNIGIACLLIISILCFTLFIKRIRIFLIITLTIDMIIVFGNDIVIFYYGYILMVFTPLALILISIIYEELNDKANTILHRTNPFFIVSVIVLSFCILLTGKNLYLIFRPYEEMPQYVFSQLINQTDNPRILTYDVMDMGFYNASNNLPSNKYFCFLNIEENLPEILDSQDRLIDEGYFDYIITYSNEYQWDNYNIISEAEYTFPYQTGEVILERYYLYENVR